jgi:hypothetical protein
MYVKNKITLNWPCPFVKLMKFIIMPYSQLDLRGLKSIICQQITMLEQLRDKPVVILKKMHVLTKNKKKVELFPFKLPCVKMLHTSK